MSRYSQHGPMPCLLCLGQPLLWFRFQFPSSFCDSDHSLADVSFVFDGQVWPLQPQAFCSLSASLSLIHPTSSVLPVQIRLSNEKGTDSPCPVESCLPSISHFCCLVFCDAKPVRQQVNSLGSKSHGAVTLQNVLAGKAFRCHRISTRTLPSNELPCRIMIQKLDFFFFKEVESFLVETDPWDPPIFQKPLGVLRVLVTPLSPVWKPLI